MGNMTMLDWLSTTTVSLVVLGFVVSWEKYEAVRNSTTSFLYGLNLIWVLPAGILAGIAARLASPLSRNAAWYSYRRSYKGVHHRLAW